MPSFVVHVRLTLAIICVVVAATAALAQPGSNDFLSNLAEARAASSAQQWEKAATSWAKVVEANPVSADYWRQLAAARYYAKDYRGSIQSFEQSMKLLTAPSPTAAYNIARCYARLNEKDKAWEWLQKSFDYGFRSVETAQKDQAFEFLRADPRFQRLLGLADTSKMSREEGWRYDLAYLSQEVKRRAVPQFHARSEKDFDLALRKLNDALPGLTDAQVVVEIMKVMRFVGDGHSVIFGPPEKPELLKQLPIDVAFFKEGLFITMADAAHQDLLGMQITQFDNSSIEQVLAKFDPLISRDNEMAPLVRVPMFARSTPLLHALGLISSPDKVALTVVDAKGQTRTATVSADSMISSRRLWDQIPDGWKAFHQSLSGPAPLYLKDMFRPYWFEYLPETKTVYFQFNRVQNDEAEPLAKFSERLFKFIDANDVQKLVIDMRWNNGGNSLLEPPLIHGLIANQKINQTGKLFVIIGRRTFSAAQNGATWLERHTNAIFAGEPTGSSPNFVGEESPFQLPYSKIWANVSDLYWESSWPMDNRAWIAPMLYAPPSFVAYRNNRDPAMDAIAAYREVK